MSGPVAPGALALPLVGPLGVALASVVFSLSDSLSLTFSPEIRFPGVGISTYWRDSGRAPGNGRCKNPAKLLWG